MFVVLSRDDPTLTPKIIVDHYIGVYHKVNGHRPNVRHVGGPWYTVNGETVHRIMLMSEIRRLHQEAQHQKTYASANRSMIQRLITRLRGI